MDERTPRERTGRLAGLLRAQLNDMMVAAHGLSGLLQESRKGREYLGIIDRGLHRQLRLVRHLEMEHKLTSEDEVRAIPGPVDLVPTCRALMESVAELVDILDIRVGFQCRTETFLIEADQSLLEEMLLYLVANSVQAIGRDGSIALALEERNGQAVFTLSDDGGGADAGAMAGFFGQAEEETDIPEAPGMGLGLPLARRIAELHGGFLLVDSYEGKGMKVVAVIPGREPDAPGLLRCERPPIRDEGWSRAAVELSECLPLSYFTQKAPEG